MGRLQGRANWLRLAPSANARSLAVLRIAVGLAVLPTAWRWVRSDWALLPRELWRPPTGTGWVAEWIPVAPAYLEVAAWLFMAAAMAVLVGFWARWAAGLAVLTGIYVGWVPNLAGKVDHNHHLIWFLALLAISPCADVLAARATKTRRNPARYALPALAGVVLLGIIYLSSAVPKIMTGPDWVFSDNLRNLMWNLWWEKQYEPPIPVDQWPVVYQAMGLATVAFEITFLPTALYAPTRAWIRWVGLVFHLVIRFLLAINFWTLAVLYVVLFDWDRRATEAGRQDPGDTSIAPLILSLVVAVGAFTIPSGWPLSQYPGFGGLYAPIYVDYELVSEDGVQMVTRSALAETHGPQRARPMAAAAMGSETQDAFLDYASLLSGHDPGFFFDLRAIEVSTVPRR